MFTINFRRELQRCCVGGPRISSASMATGNSTVLLRHSVIRSNLHVSTPPHLRHELTYLPLTERDKRPSSETLFASAALSFV
jgi:hypothetical protein